MSDNKYLIPILLIGTVIILIIGSTLAYWNWQSTNAEKTNVTFTVGSNFSCGADGGGNITNTNYFVPTDCTNSTYAIQRTITTSITNNSADDIYMDMWLNINSIGSGLSNSDYFKYALTTSSSSCTAGVISSGNFKGLTTNDKVTLLSSATTGSTYYLYIWLDAAETSQSTMNQSISLSLGGECTNNAATMTLYNKIASEADLTKTIDFSIPSSDTNGKGVYRFPGTENNTYPVYYYRGIVDNNVKFANYCWKAIRTTDTGGVKLIYNGVPADIYEYAPLSQSDYTIVSGGNDFTWDETDGTWNTTITYEEGQKIIEFTLPEGDGYRFELIHDYVYLIDSDLYKDSNFVCMGTKCNLDTLTTSNVIKVELRSWNEESDPLPVKILITKSTGNLIKESGCDIFKAYDDTIQGTSYNNYGSVADIGYMYGERYAGSSIENGKDLYYAPDVTYENGMYTLVGKGDYNVEKKSTIDGTNLNYHHYTCGSKTATTCTSVKYVHYVFYDRIHYITLSNGKKVEDALSAMLDNSSNENNSMAKEIIDNWYRDNMINYTKYLEDTIYCNDRSLYNLTSSGWNPDGGNPNKTPLYFNTYARLQILHQPSITCYSKNDSFTVSNSNIGNGKLIYPVGLITSDEALLAGAILLDYNTDVSRLKNYLNNHSQNESYWTMSPGYTVYNETQNAEIYDGVIDITALNYKWIGLRPVISLKYGMKISEGDGTIYNPYVIS